MRVVGWGTALPDTVIGNAYFEDRLDTSDTWIRQRTGIVERRWGSSTAELAVRAGADALARAGIDRSDVDALVLATTTPDRQIPPTSVAVHHQMGLRCGAFDLDAACSGFVYALVTARGLLDGGMDVVLVIGSETLSRFTDQHYRATAVLMGDGAGALAIARSDDDRMLAVDLGCDGAAGDLLYAEIGSTMVMQGPEVFKRAVTCCVESSRVALERAGLRVADVDLFVPHQANLRIVQAVAERLGLAPNRLAVTVDRTGNTSAASIPITLGQMADSGRLASGDTILMAGFGAGMTWGSAAVRWG
jgi:3-oxoacyl-[acyl-carrier-protein] synthase III